MPLLEALSILATKEAETCVQIHDSEAYYSEEMIISDLHDMGAIGEVTPREETKIIDKFDEALQNEIQIILDNKEEERKHDQDYYNSVI